jgi:hypothetical protein
MYKRHADFLPEISTLVENNHAVATSAGSLTLCLIFKPDFMKSIKLLLTIAILTFGQLTFACECGSQGDFLKVAGKTQFVALVKVTKFLTFKDIYKEKTPMSMEVEIIEIYKGKETRKKVTVWGDNGILCRPYLSKFELGKYYVIAFFKGSEGTKGLANENEKVTDYSISICGEFWLNADKKNKFAESTTAEYKTRIKLKELKTKLNVN